MQRLVNPGEDAVGLSGSLWSSGQFLFDEIMTHRDRRYGWGVKDDFSNYGLVSALSSNLGLYVSEGNSYRTFEKAGGASAQAIVPTNTAYTVPTGFPINSPNGSNILVPAGTVLPTPGQLVFTPSAASDQAQIQLGPNTASANTCPFAVIPGQSGNLIFECRLKFSALATGFTNFFIGLAGSGSAVTSRPAASTAYDNNTSLLGFGTLSGDTTGQIGWVYNKAGGTVQQQSVSNMSALNLLTLGSTTPYGGQLTGPAVYMKLGFFYNGYAQTVTPFINGAPLLSKVIGKATAAGSSVPAGTGSSTAWPADYMTLCAGLFQSSTTYQTVTLDWWAVGQEAAIRST